MAEFMTKKEFDKLNEKIDRLPNIIQDKITISMHQFEKNMNETNKRNQKSMITWTLSGIGLLIAFAGLIGNVLGLF
ncbi:hypothetical protein [Mammaliicoccus sp. Dog046]|uniref:hypothetical protein n=1 Tax=Mammaliicoccus sp. Dog046 TaxID=3034233 RepID=UPI002B2596EF|nr:hypothetical protein [Mammaliicoccus sp. Dog046]WQK84941.1 hypothetical protein P3U32_09940 [Mammaliicoccus sp. Dog046]